MSIRTLVDLKTGKEYLVFDPDRTTITPTQATIDNLTNKVTTLEIDVGNLKSDVGDESDGLIKDVNDLIEDTTTLQNDVDELGDDVSVIQEKIPDDAAANNPLMTESGVETRLSYLKTLPPYPTDDGVYQIQLEISDGQPTLVWVEIE